MQPKMKIAVAMSGGVDSSAAAAILKNQGHEVIGFTMQLWNQRRGINVDENDDPLPSRCCSLDDTYDARRVAEQMGFPFYVLNLERDFERAVVEPFVAGYLSGETPIPCVACNSRLKFASLDRLAQSLDCEKVATGHYARVQFDQSTRRYKLLRGRYLPKDQSYFLWELTQHQLSRALFPLGEMTKSEVREIARTHNLITVAEKTESQEICFVPDGDYAGFIDRYLAAQNEVAPGGGEILNTRGQVIGRHGGIHRYTIGQRRGLGITNSEPLYVVALDAVQNLVVAGTKEELKATSFVATGVNWIAFKDPPATVRASVRVRYRHDPSPATIELINETEVRIVFDNPQCAITPGQATLFYNDDEVLGGGWIIKNGQ